MITLGIETSCDETALALIESREVNGKTEYRVINSLVHSQAKLHSAYGGVYPNLAKREHAKNIVPLLHKLLIDSKDILENINQQKNKPTHKDLNEFMSTCSAINSGQNIELWQSLKDAKFLEQRPPIDRIAVTEGPGLEPALWVGIVFARFIGTMWDCPVIPVNHMEGHIIGSLLPSDKPYGVWQGLYEAKMPSIALLISGGHTELVLVKNHQNTHTNRNFSYTIIGQTRDDAVGEAFDKAARVMGLPYPGGPHISMLAEQARKENINSNVTLPRPMINSNDFDFSFSGLKTAVLYAVRDATKNNNSTLSDDFKKGLAREFEEAVGDVIQSKLSKVISEKHVQSIIVGGGVSANNYLRELLKQIADKNNLPLYLPSRHISGDNALMIAIVGSMKELHKGEIVADGTKRI